VTQSLDVGAMILPLGHRNPKLLAAPPESLDVDGSPVTPPDAFTTLQAADSGVRRGSGRRLILDEEEVGRKVALPLAPAVSLHCAVLLVLIGVASVSLLREAAFWPGFGVGLGVGLYTWFEAVRKARGGLWLALMQKAWME
jgi:hypothetical protein